MTKHTSPEICTCLAIRQAARHVSQFYDQHLAPCGLRATQYSILSKLQGEGRLTINRLAEMMVMDRTTLGRNILPLQRVGLIAVVQGTADRRSKELHLTNAGEKRLSEARICWAKAQAGFDVAFGSGKDLKLRTLMRAVTSTDLVAAVSKAPARRG
jgi:DNA-binding MarR family transcriptional regulator